MKRLKRPLAATLAMLLLASCGAKAPKATPDDQVESAQYTASAPGMNGDVPVTVTIKGGKIENVTVGENKETPNIATHAIEQLPQQIVDTQSIALDAVSGATVTSKAILAAVEAALVEAGLNVDDFKVAPENDGPIQGEAETTQVVIVGGGMAGLMAAYELKENHPEIDYILLEKLDMLTGSIPTTGGAITATTSKLHSADGVEYATGDIVDLFTYTSGADINGRLVENVYRDSSVAMNRLIDWGCKFINPSPSSKYSDKVITYWHDGRGAGLATAMNAYMDKDPANVRLGTKVQSLLVEDGKVVGVHAVDKEKEYDIHADRVILATGGFGSNEEYMEKYLPLFADGFSSTNAGATGDGITMTEQFGTKVIGDGSMGSIVAPDGSALMASNFIVNKAGQRFIGEGEPKYVVQRAISQQEDKAGYLIADSTYADMDTIQDKIEKGYVKQYDTLEELAADNGIDPDGLLATVKAYNDAADAGKDIPAEEYSLAASAATKVEKAPFYIEKAVLRTFGTIPGLEVNENCQILNGDGVPVEGLYGAGELIAGNVFTRQYPGAGIGISWAANSGRYAAVEAVKDLK